MRRASVTRVDSTVADADPFSPIWKIGRTGEGVTENDLTYHFVDYVNTAVVSQGSAGIPAEPCSFSALFSKPPPPFIIAL